VPSPPYETNSLARSVKFFPLVGIIVGGGAAALHLVLAQHVSRWAASFLVLVYLVLLTGGLHEDGLADAADGFGGGTSREQILSILRDSRIGTYGGVALALSLIGRVVLIASIPLPLVPYYLVTAQMLSRWTTLPLSHFLSSARTQSVEQVDGQGARIARLTSTTTLIGGTIFTFTAAGMLLRSHAVSSLFIAIFFAWLTASYYKRRIGGVTGDCFGATMQLTEAGVYLCGAWMQ
jgi:adenosylcobinamide-GDP ribazoletransferase